MEMSNFRPEVHVAQGRRHDKLRIQQNSTPTHNLEDYTHNFGLNPDHDIDQLRRSYRFATEPAVLSAEMINFPTNSQVILPHKDQISANNLIPSAKVHSDSPNCSTWTSIGSQQNFDWIINYSTGSVAAIDNNYKDASPSSRQSDKKNFEEMHCNYALHQNTLEEVVSSATVGTQGQNTRENLQESWADRGSELNRAYDDDDQSNILRVSNSFDFMNRTVEGCYDQWNGDPNVTQGPFLSLSFVPPSRTQLDQTGERNYSKDLQSSTFVFNDLQDSKDLYSEYLCSNSKTPICNKVVGSGYQNNMVGTSNFSNRSTGPRGPFTGYAIILKCSKFLKPAQKLLDEFCTSPKYTRKGAVSEKIYEEIRVSGDIGEAIEYVVGAKGGDSGTFYSSNQISGEAVEGRSFCESYHQKKAKLLHMQEEVWRKYKQHHQQMQMVVSSFESVAGLSAAVPYISLAQKSVSRHFKFLKNSISDQLRQIRKALGEDFSSPTTVTINTTVDSSIAKSKFVNNKSGGSSVEFFDPQRVVWRPQRGLPECAVSILRAWLFDHFLHPYPTDTDKHLLAIQTGLSRNQVSNWFINARVRIWKPMVEEIHILETKGLAETSSKAGKPEGKSTTEGASRLNHHQSINRLSRSFISDEQVNCSGLGSSSCRRDGLSTEKWNQEKRSRMDVQIPASMGGSLIGFVPHQQSRVDIGGVGAVSLTLGLNQSADSLQYQQNFQPQEHLFSQHVEG